MNRRTRRIRRGTIAGMVAAAAAGLSSGLLPAFAQVIGDPLGVASFGTGGDSATASALAVSSGGSASASTGVGISATGTGNGGVAGASATGGGNGSLVGVSGTGCANTGNTFANAPLAVSITGCAGSFGTAISGTGTANGGVAGVSGTGNSSGLVGVSGTGHSSGAYSVDSYGEVTAEGQQVSVWTGALVAPTSPDQLLDPNFVKDNTPSAQELAAKQQAAATITPSVAKDLATMATQTPFASTTLLPPLNRTPASSPADSTPAAWWYLSGGGNGGWWFMQWQRTNATCGPASTNEVLSNLYNEPDSEYQIADIEHGHNGTNFDNIKTASNYLYKQHGGGYNYFWTEEVHDMQRLMTIVTEDVYYGPHNRGIGNGVILDVQPEPLPWWRAAGYSSPSGHYFAARGYDHRGAGEILVFDQFNLRALQGRDPSTDKVYGDHWAKLAEMASAMNGHGAPFGEVIW